MDSIYDRCKNHFRNILGRLQKEASLDTHFSKREAPETKGTDNKKAKNEN